MQDELPPHSVNSIKVADKEAAGIISQAGLFAEELENTFMYLFKK